MLDDQIISTTSSNPNMLNAATTTQYEIGWKSIVPEIGNFNAALFTASSNNEIVALNNISGKTVYQNANATARTGFELFAHLDLPYRFYSNLSYTYTMAQVTQDYNSAVSGLISAGSNIPGVPVNKFFGELAWKLPADKFNLGAEILGVSNMFASDNNNSLNSNSSGYVIANVRAFAKQSWNQWKFTEFARVNNVFDVYYVGSVIINQTNSQYFEPAPGRNWIIGTNATYQF